MRFKSASSGVFGHISVIMHVCTLLGHLNSNLQCLTQAQKKELFHQTQVSGWKDYPRSTLWDISSDVRGPSCGKRRTRLHASRLFLERQLEEVPFKGVFEKCQVGNVSVVIEEPSSSFLRTTTQKWRDANVEPMWAQLKKMTKNVSKQKTFHDDHQLRHELFR